MRHVWIRDILDRDLPTIQMVMGGYFDEMSEKDIKKVFNPKTDYIAEYDAFSRDLVNNACFINKDNYIVPIIPAMTERSFRLVKNLN